MAKEYKQHFSCITCKVTACGADYDTASQAHGTPICNECATKDLTDFIGKHMSAHLKKP